jgi:cytochrome b561
MGQPRDMPPAMQLAARLSHLVFYGLMLALPLIGWAMLSAADYPVIAGGIHLPSIAPVDPGLHATLWKAHRFLALLFFALILLHLAAGLYHALVRKDGVYEAMAPVSGTDR